MRQSLRSLRRDWLFSLATIAILSIGIAANTSVFTLINTILLKPLPYRAPGELMHVETSLPDILPIQIPFSSPDVRQFRQRTKAFAEVAAVTARELDLSGPIEPVRINAARLEAQTWNMLGVPPLLGRLFDVDEDVRADRLIVLSYGLWQRQFGGDPNIVGRGVDVDRRAYTITAVMPKGFVYPPPSLKTVGQPAEAWVPMSFTKEELSNPGDNFNNTVIARRHPGLAPQAIEQDLARVGREILTTYPAGNPVKKLNFPATPLLDEVVGDSRSLLVLLVACVGGVLWIGCANIASLMLAKAAGRREEYAVRKALGATTWQLMRQSFAEALLLAIPGACLGLLLAAWGIEILVQLAPSGLPRLDEVSVDVRVAGFTLLLSIFSALAFALAPAWQASRADPGPMRGGSKGGSQSKGSLRLGHALVSVEVALCFVLLGATGLLIETYRNLLATDPGFSPRKLLAFEVAPRPAAYGESLEQRMAFFERLDQKLATLPGLKGISYADAAPLAMARRRIFLLEGQRFLAAKVPQDTHHSVISPGHFANIGARLLEGREFLPTDRAGSQPVCIVNRTLARKFFPTGALGKRIRFGGPDSNAPLLTIVGVVDDFKVNELDEKPAVQSFEAILQQPSAARTYFLKTTSDPAPLAQPVRDAIRALDASQVVAQLRTMEQVIDTKAASRKFQMLLLSVFGGAALLLAFTGIFGVIANTIERQTKEIGIRMALGAGPLETLRLVLWRALRPVLLGLGLGIVAFEAAGKAMETFLYGVRPGDPTALGVAATVMLLAALAAIWFPARWAVSVSPSTALRAD